MDAQASSKRAAARWTDLFSFPSNAFMRLIVSLSMFFFFFCFCTHREMDRLGIITPSHQDIITASLQQEMLSQMQHMQHTMVPVWVGKRMETCSEKSFHLPHLCTLEGLPDGMSKREREKEAALLPTSILWNFLKNKRQKRRKKRPWTRTQIAVSYSELRLRLHPLSFQYSIVCFVKAAQMQNGFQPSFSLLWPRTWLE